MSPSSRGANAPPSGSTPRTGASLIAVTNASTRFGGSIDANALMSSSLSGAKSSSSLNKSEAASEPAGRYISGNTIGRQRAPAYVLISGVFRAARRRRVTGSLPSSDGPHSTTSTRPAYSLIEEESLEAPGMINIVGSEGAESNATTVRSPSDIQPETSLRSSASSTASGLTVSTNRIEVIRSSSTPAIWRSLNSFGDAKTAKSPDAGSPLTITAPVLS